MRKIFFILINNFDNFIFRMSEAGQKPVLLSREIEGFALNRIQYAILNECWHLINDDILSVKDIDSVMSDGLGMRYAFLGPMVI
jgi:L-gulonate 3-dehydrogenase